MKASKNRHGQKQKNCPGTHQLGKKITNRSINSCPGTKPYFQIAVCRYAADSALEGHKKFNSENGSNRNGETEYIGIPVSRKCISRQCQKAYAADKGGKNGHSNYPCR